MGGDPTGDPCTDLEAQLVIGLVEVLAFAQRRDRDQVVAVLAIHANVVIVDDLAQLRRDCAPDRAHVR